MQLPRSLTCLTLEYVITDRNAVERYLEFDPEAAEYCIPIAVRNLLKPYAEKSEMSSSMLTKDMLWRCLQVLWGIGGLERIKPSLAARYGATYILPYLDAQCQQASERGIRDSEYCPHPVEMISLATVYGHWPFLKHLLSKYDADPSHLLFDAAMSGRWPIVIHILNRSGYRIDEQSLRNALNEVEKVYQGHEKPKMYSIDYFIENTGMEPTSSKDYQDVINILNYFIKYRKVPQYGWSYQDH